MSVWVEITVLEACEVFPKSRSTWACELKLPIKTVLCIPSPSHAPRERVSWNSKELYRAQSDFVTLHVSVWVEMSSSRSVSRLARSRSTWACELKCDTSVPALWRSWSRSTWACELKWTKKSRNSQRIWSRSTWACELKCLAIHAHDGGCHVTLHVSVWVEIGFLFSTIFVRLVTLHVSVWVEISP